MKVSETTLVAFACVLATASAYKAPLYDAVTELHKALDKVCFGEAPDDETISGFAAYGENYFKEIMSASTNGYLTVEDIEEARELKAKAENCQNTKVHEDAAMVTLMKHLVKVLRAPHSVLLSEIQQYDVSSIKPCEDGTDVYKYLQYVESKLPKPRRISAYWLDAIVTKEELGALREKISAVQQNIVELEGNIQALETEVEDYDRQVSWGWKIVRKTGRKLYNRVIGRLKALKTGLEEIDNLVLATVEYQRQEGEEEDEEDGEEDDEENDGSGSGETPQVPNGVTTGPITPDTVPNVSSTGGEITESNAAEGQNATNGDTGGRSEPAGGNLGVPLTVDEMTRSNPREPSSVTPPANEGTDSTTGGPGVAEIVVKETKQNEENLVKTEIVVVEPTGPTGENPEGTGIVVKTTDSKTLGDTLNEEETVEGMLDPSSASNVTSQQTSVGSGEEPSFFKRHRGKIVVMGIVVILLAGALVGAYMVLGH